MKKRITVKVEKKVHKKLKMLQYLTFKKTGTQYSLSDLIEMGMKL